VIFLATLQLLTNGFLAPKTTPGNKVCSPTASRRTSGTKHLPKLDTVDRHVHSVRMNGAAKAALREALGDPDVRLG
jgi:hypothetical protein